jgi:hypothetical protein
MKDDRDISLDFVIIGAQKAASTFITKCLEEHPDVFIPPEEIRYFESPLFEEQTYDDFLKLFTGYENLLLGIKRPDYLANPDVPERIFNANPDTKLICILRDPLKRVVSAYYHYMAYGYIPKVNIETGLTRILNGEYEDAHPRSTEILENGLYFKHLTTYRKYFDERNIFVLLQDDLVRNQGKAVCSIFDFLNLDSSFISSRLNARPSAVIYSIPRLKFTSLANGYKYNYLYGGQEVEVKERSLFEKAITKTIYKIDHHVLARLFGNEAPELSNRLIKRIRSVYSDDLRNLNRLINRDLSSWMA